MIRRIAVILLLLCMPVYSSSYAESISSITIAWTPSYDSLSEMKQTAYMLSVPNRRLTVQEKRSATGEMIYEQNHTVTPEIVRYVLQTMQRYDFFALPLYIETGIMDGYVTVITVITDASEYTVSGVNANEYGPEAFQQIWQAIMMVYSEAKG